LVFSRPNFVGVRPAGPDGAVFIVCLPNTRVGRYRRRRRFYSRDTMPATHVTPSAVPGSIITWTWSRLDMHDEALAAWWSITFYSNDVHITTWCQSPISPRFN